MAVLPGRPGAGALTGLTQFEDVIAAAVGSTGQVYRARQPETDRWVAVKVMGTTLDDPGARRRFDRELAVTGRLSGHPYVITILEYGVTLGGQPYLVMPWYENGSLADDLARRGPWGLPEVLGLGVRIAAGLDHAHGHGVLHGDVKPANILLSGPGGVVLADFGGSAGPGDASPAFSPGHAAPELLRGEPVGDRSDVWSLTSTLYSALTGHRPFAGGPASGGLAGELTRTVTDPLPPVDRPDVPFGLEHVLASGLAKLPADRPSALELAQALQRLQADAGLPVTEIPGRGGSEPVPRPPQPPPPDPDPDPPTVIRPAPEPVRARSRRPAAAVAAGAVLAVAAAGIVGVAAVRARAPGAVGPTGAVAAPAMMVARRTPVEPVAAGGLRIAGRGATTVALRWQDSNAGRSGYLVLVDPDARGTGPVPAGESTGQVVSGLDPRTSYCFRVATGDGDVAPVTAPVCTRTR